MADLREMFSARVLPVVKMMIAAEAEARGFSEGQLLDDLTLAYCRSPKAVAILREYGRRHPVVMALAELDTAPTAPALAQPAAPPINYKKAFRKPKGKVA